MITCHQSTLHTIQLNIIWLNTLRSIYIFLKKLDSAIIYTSYFSTDKQLLDILTKGLGGLVYQILISKLGLI